MTCLTRRNALALSAGAAATTWCGSALPTRAEAMVEGHIESHGMSAFGDLGYPPDFRQFRYVDAKAVKGGTFSQIGPDRAYNQNFLTF